MLCPRRSDLPWKHQELLNFFNSIFSYVFDCLYTISRNTFRAGKPYHHLEPRSQGKLSQWQEIFAVLHIISQLQGPRYFFKGGKHTSDVAQIMWNECKPVHLSMIIIWFSSQKSVICNWRIITCVSHLQQWINQDEGGNDSCCILGWGHRITTSTL